MINIIYIHYVKIYDVDRGTFYNHLFQNKKNAWFIKSQREYRILIQNVFD